MNKKILWVDDEIDFFRAHIEFLKTKGYYVTGVTNGDDGVELFKNESFDMVLLDEMMIGMDGLETLTQIRNIDIHVPIVMITKNEGEELMQSAIAQRITDFLTKPVNPSQILSVFLKIFSAKEIQQRKTIENLNRDFIRIRERLQNVSSPTEWIDMYKELLRLENQYDFVKDKGLDSVFNSLKEEINNRYAVFIKNNYPQLLLNNDNVLFSHQFIPKVIFPLIKNGKRVFFFLLDCMRADQWLSMSSVIKDDFNINTQYYYSILPTATPYSRNAIFSGKLPLTLQQSYPNLIPWFKETESGKNDNEYDLLLKLMDEYGIYLKGRPYFTKILDASWAGEVHEKMSSLKKLHFVTFVFNFLDIIIHHRANSKVLQEIVFDENSFKRIARDWFENSWIYRIIQKVAQIPDAVIVLTTDHGSILCNKPVVIKGDSKISYSLRFKIGNYLKIDERHGWLVKEPSELFLPKSGVLTNYAFSYNNNYFAFTGNVGQFSEKYNNNFFHGGISLEEMILPYAIITPKK